MCDNVTCKLDFYHKLLQFRLSDQTIDSLQKILDIISKFNFFIYFQPNKFQTNFGQQMLCLDTAVT